MESTDLLAVSKTHKFFSYIVEPTLKLDSPLTLACVIQVLKGLNSSPIELSVLKELGYYSKIPDEISAVRPIVWKVLLEHLPLKLENWESEMEQRDKDYQMLVDKLYTGVAKQKKGHPLNDDKQSEWSQYFNDVELLENIRKDVKRTKTSINFFNLVTNEESNMDRLVRILFVYAKLNPDISYVQGMNEILAVIFFVFSRDTNPAFLEVVESDCFFCFSRLIDYFRNLYNRDFDNSQQGIQGAIKKLEQLLSATKPEIVTHLKSLEVDLNYFAFRWITLLFTQEFDLPDIMVIWDFVFSVEKKLECLVCLSAAVMIVKKTSLLNSGFAEIMQEVQNVRNENVEQILKLAKNLLVEYFDEKAL